VDVGGGVGGAEGMGPIQEYWEGGWGAAQIALFTLCIVIGYSMNLQGERREGGHTHIYTRMNFG